MTEFPDYSKLLLPLVGFLVVAPLMGLLAAPSRKTRAGLFFLIIVLQCVKTTNYGVMVYSIEWYRGHTKGFEFTLADVLCIALLVALFLSRPGKFRFMPPGLPFYLLFVFVAAWTYHYAYEPLYTWMAVWSFAKASLIYLAAFNFIRDKDDLRVLFHAMAVALIIECVVVMNQKYLLGSFQPTGLFDHQNSMCMWAYFFAIPLLAVALSRETRPRDAAVYLAGAACGAVAVIAALSRGSVGVLVVGFALVLLAALMIGGFSRRRLAIVALGGAFGMLVLLKASDSIVQRFENSADVGDPDSDFRVLLNRVAENMLDDTGVGVGLNNFNVANSRPYLRYSRYYEEYYGGYGHSRDPRFYTRNANTESLYWMYLAETGYRGFLALVLFMAVTLWWAARAFWQRGDRRDTTAGFFLMGLLVTLCGLYFHSTIERVLTQTNNLWCWLAFLGVAARFEQARRERTRPRRLARTQLVWNLLREFAPRRGAGSSIARS